jgi:hypothetical protein
MLGGDGLWVGLRTDLEFLSTYINRSNSALSASGMFPTSISVSISILEFTEGSPKRPWIVPSRTGLRQWKINAVGC